MFHAYAAALRSGDMGRQVGAAITTSEGALVATGANEIPVFGGGLYWADHGDPDPRDWVKGWDANDRRKLDLAAAMANDLKKAGVVTDSQAASDVIVSSRFDDLIEFVRAVHAEMAAITDAAMRGVAVKDAILYATTFPCHHCARHIVAAGISRVEYIEPYSKSRAQDLHSDSIAVDDPKASDRVIFESFVGVGPRRFIPWFTAPPRKNRATGRSLEFEQAQAQPRVVQGPGVEQPERPAYVLEEVLSINKLLDAMEHGPAFIGVDLSGPDQASEGTAAAP